MKIAISIPDPIFEVAEHLAQERRIHGGPAITVKLNEVHESAAVLVEPALTKAQMRMLNEEAW